MQQQDRDGERAPGREPAPPPLPTSLIPRWLALLVLLLLLASGVATTWLVLG